MRYRIKLILGGLDHFFESHGLGKVLVRRGFTGCIFTLPLVLQQEDLQIMVQLLAIIAGLLFDFEPQLFRQVLKIREGRRSERYERSSELVEQVVFQVMGRIFFLLGQENVVEVNQQALIIRCFSEVVYLPNV